MTIEIPAVLKIDAEDIGDAYEQLNAALMFSGVRAVITAGWLRDGRAVDEYTIEHMIKQYELDNPGRDACTYLYSPITQRV